MVFARRAAASPPLLARRRPRTMSDISPRCADERTYQRSGKTDAIDPFRTSAIEISCSANYPTCRQILHSGKLRLLRPSRSLQARSQPRVRDASACQLDGPRIIRNLEILLPHSPRNWRDWVGSAEAALRSRNAGQIRMSGRRQNSEAIGKHRSRQTNLVVEVIEGPLTDWLAVDQPHRLCPTGQLRGNKDAIPNYLPLAAGHGKLLLFHRRRRE